MLSYTSESQVILKDAQPNQISVNDNPAHKSYVSSAHFSLLGPSGGMSENTARITSALEEV
jgi:hypothetical protein